jgi:hypothetical protein
MARRAPIFLVQEELFRDKLSKVVVAGDGNCLFYSLLTVAGRPLGDQMSFRQLCAEFFASRWLECPPSSGRRSSTYAARLNDCYSGEPAFRGINPCFPDADAYVGYITRDQAWAGMSEIEVLSILWERPIIVWSSDGLPKPGLINFVKGVSPINIVYSNGNHYDALVGLECDASLIAATDALHKKGRISTLSAGANLVDLAGAHLSSSPKIDAVGPSTVSFPLSSKSSVPKRKADLPSMRSAKKGSHNVDGVSKAHNKWRVGINVTILGVKQSRLTVPFDYLTENVANKVHYFLRCFMSGTEVDPKICDLEPAIVEQLQDFLLELRSGTIDACLNKVKANARSVKQPSPIPKSNLRGVLCNDGVWVVRIKLQDVFGKEKSTKFPFVYLLEKDAGLAYDFAIVHYCFIINQKMTY